MEKNLETVRPRSPSAWHSSHQDERSNSTWPELSPAQVVQDDTEIIGVLSPTESADAVNGGIMDVDTFGGLELAIDLGRLSSPPDMLSQGQPLQVQVPQQDNSIPRDVTRQKSLTILRNKGQPRRSLRSRRRPTGNPPTISRTEPMTGATGRESPVLTDDQLSPTTPYLSCRFGSLLVLTTAPR